MGKRIFTVIGRLRLEVFQEYQPPGRSLVTFFAIGNGFKKRLEALKFFGDVRLNSSALMKKWVTYFASHEAQHLAQKLIVAEGL